MINSLNFGEGTSLTLIRMKTRTLLPISAALAALTLGCSPGTELAASQPEAALQLLAVSDLALETSSEDFDPDLGGDGLSPETLDPVRYNQRLKLWQDRTSTDPLTFRYFEDQALTLPAGFKDVAHDDTLDGLAAKRYEHDIDAGPWAGYSLKSLRAATGEGRKFMVEGAIPGKGTFITNGELTASQATTTTTWSGEGRTFTVATTIYKEPVNGVKVNQKTSGSSGYGSDLNFRGDRTGFGTITGPDRLLPAQIVWEADGTVTITWSNGRVFITSWDELRDWLGGLNG